MIPSASKQHIEQQICKWLDTVVIGLNLCPFAAPVRRADSVRVAICAAADEDEKLVQLLQELDLLQSSDEEAVSTTLLVFPRGLEDFDGYWAFVELANAVLAEAGLEGVIQLATFHPDYLFEGESKEAVSHFTNRSPYPMLHLIREQQLERVLAQFPDAGQIPQRNIDTLQALGKPRLLTLLAGCEPGEK